MKVMQFAEYIQFELTFITKQVINVHIRIDVQSFFGLWGLLCRQRNSEKCHLQQRLLTKLYNL